MECDLCKRRDLHLGNDLLCENCADMIQRLLSVQKRMGLLKPPEAASAVAPSTVIKSWLQWQ